MELSLTKRSQYLLELLLTNPPQFESAKNYLDGAQLSVEEVTRAANIYADRCFRDYDEYLMEICPDDCPLSDVLIPQGIVPGLPSTYLYDVVKLLLRYGLDPNAVYDTDSDVYNIMRLVLFIDNEYVAADTMRLLLDHGGDPNLMAGFETIFECIDADVWFGSVEQEFRWRYDSWVHVWMVLLAYGGKFSETTPKIETFREYENYQTDDKFDLSKLRDHRNYCFGLTLDNNERILHIFDKRTFREVAWV